MQSSDAVFRVVPGTTEPEVGRVVEGGFVLVDKEDAIPPPGHEAATEVLEKGGVLDETKPTAKVRGHVGKEERVPAQEAELCDMAVAGRGGKWP
jgi:hypothetical protein